jgi:probable FeS assembly SUF system protein SufT
MVPMSDPSVILSRDCMAIQVPYGNEIVARAGTQMTVVHQLGDTYTVRSEHGYLLRIAGDDADALGLEKPQENVASKDGAPLDEAGLWEVMKTIYDPEIPANIVELGLVYEVHHTALPDNKQHIDVKMTLTAPGCGMGQVLQDDVKRKLSEQPGVVDVVVELTFDPPWDPTMMSEAARLQLGMM